MAESDADDLDVLMHNMWQVHVASPYKLNLALAPLLDKAAATKGYADIIHMTDFAAQNGSNKHIAYAASKAGLANLTLSFAKKLAPA